MRPRTIDQLAAAARSHGVHVDRLEHEATDWFEAGGLGVECPLCKDGHAAIVKQLAYGGELDGHCPQCFRDVVDLLGQAPMAVNASRLPLDFVYMSDVKMRSVEWLEKPLWQARTFTLLAGAKGMGKGTYLARLAAKVSRGDFHGRGMNVVFISSEDSAEIDIKPRLVAADADLDRCVLITDTFRLPDDLDRLRAVVAEIDDVAVVVIDPVSNHIGDRNSNAEGEVRDAIAPLNQLADDLGCLIIGVRHPGKNRTSGAVAAILGSTAWVDTPRAVVMIAVDPEDEAIRHIQVVAGNRSATRGGVKFRIDGVMLDGLTEEVPVAVELGASEINIDDLFAPDVKDAPAPSKTRRARDLLLDRLEDDLLDGVESDTLDAHVAAATGLSAKTVRNVRGELAKEGLIKPRPELDEHGQPQRWIVFRTGAPRP
jgi:hypothetical protein